MQLQQSPIDQWMMLVSFSSFSFSFYLHYIQMYPVWCDGRFLGYIPIEKSAIIERELRITKARAYGVVPSVAEVFYNEVR